MALPWLQKGHGAPAGRARAEDQPEAGLAGAARARVAGIEKKRQETACVEEGGGARSASRAKEEWSCDFISDATAEGRSVRIVSAHFWFTPDADLTSVPASSLESSQTSFGESPFGCTLFLRHLEACRFQSSR